MSLRAALIGCGRIGSGMPGFPGSLGVYAHAAALRACPETDLIALCDPDPARLAACGNQWNVAARFLDPAQLLAETSPELVTICTPDATHYDLARLALNAPGTRGVLLEKPLALTLEEGAELGQIAAARGISLAVNYSRRYAPPYRRLREALSGGLLGPLQSIGGYYTKGTLHNGSHWFDLLRWFAGEVRWVEAVNRFDEGGPDPTLDCTLQTTDGVIVHLVGCDASAYTLFEMDILGSSGRICLTELGQNIEAWNSDDDPEAPGYLKLFSESRVTDALRDVTLHAVRDLVRSVVERDAPACGAKDALAALKIALAARQSAEWGSPVEIQSCS